MPWSYRRSAKIGPIRVNLSKSGVGYSMGNKYLRYGKTAKGRSYVSSAPVPGLRYQETLATTKSRTSQTLPTPSTLMLPAPMPQIPQRMSQGRLALTIAGVAGGLTLLFVLVGAVTNGNPTATIAPRSATIMPPATVAATPASAPTVRVAVVSSPVPTTTTAPKATIAPTPVAQSVTITAASSVNLRSGPNTDAAVLAQLDPGADATVINADVPSDVDDTHWVHVAYADQNGYIRNDLVGEPHVSAAQSLRTSTALVPTPTAIAPSNTPIPPTSAPTVIALASRVIPPGGQVVRGLDNDPVNIRESPSSQGSVVALLNPNTDALIAGAETTDVQGQRWLLVQLGPDGKNGYVRADVVSVPQPLKGTPPAVSPSAATSTRSTAPDAPTVVYSAPSGSGYSGPATGFYTDPQGRKRPITGSGRGRHK